MKPADLLPPELIEEDPLLDSAAQLEEAVIQLDLEDWIVQRLKHAEREISVSLPLVLDTGESLACAGIVVQHCSARGPCMAPILLSPGEHLAHLRDRALHMSLQLALLELPFGGGGGAIVTDPRHLSEPELRRLVEEFLWSLRDLRGPRASIFAPVDCVPAWLHRLVAPAAIVGKPAPLGGIPDSPSAIATGWLTLISAALASETPAVQRTVHGCRVAIQGFSPAAAALARLLSDAGAHVIAVADKSGGLLNERGLDIKAVAGHVQKTGMLFGFPHADPVRNSEVLESACDVLVAAATERQVNAQNVAHIRAPLILEAVHNAVTPAAARTLEERGSSLIPSLLGAAPATLVWVAEWQHALASRVPQQGVVETAVRQQLADTLQRVRAASDPGKAAALPAACLTLALERLAGVLRLTR